ncbi:hypothetical protein KP509_30G071100 [Ceratopteris richardii]|uniref:Pentatricopeptide repeat-containing protein n=1 Tax=Ceratopteris richardii TaxID=49495 RepID=A0A8T2R5D0_CERRI|nr:hypothetical protein KP509_30G071100 [Ceratopteris richardii]
MGSHSLASWRFTLGWSMEEILNVLDACRKRKVLEQTMDLLVFICSIGLDTHQSERAWTSLITGYLEAKMPQHVITLYSRVQVDPSVHPSGQMYIVLLKACSMLGDMNRTLVIHTEIMRMNSIRKDPFVGSALIDMYSKIGMLDTAHDVLKELAVRDVVSWTALIAGYANYGFCEEAVGCLKAMQQEGICANSTTFVCCIKACRSAGFMHQGQETHAEIERLGLPGNGVVLGTSLVDMYCRHGLLHIAQEIFNNLHFRNSVAWTTLIVGHTECGNNLEALKCYEQMLAEGIVADNVALICTMKACSSVKDISKGEEIHAEVERRGLIEDPSTGNVLIDMYVRFGFLQKAQEVFDRLQFRSIVSWTTLLAGYTEQSDSDNIYKLLECMQLEEISRDSVALICSLQACCIIGATSIAQEVHSEIERKGLLEKELLVGNTLIDMYSKCGSISRAHEVFTKLPMRDVVSWTSLIEGYAQVGESEDVCRMYEEMLRDAVEPDPVTFIIILGACGRKGLYKTSELYFESMSKCHGILPSLPHHIRMVGVFCRAGNLEKALAIVQKMPSHPNSVVWHIVLDACEKWGTLGLGVHAFQNALHLDAEDAGAYLLMSHIIANSPADSWV